MSDTNIIRNVSLSVLISRGEMNVGMKTKICNMVYVGVIGFTFIAFTHKANGNKKEIHILFKYVAEQSDRREQQLSETEKVIIVPYERETHKKERKRLY